MGWYTNSVFGINWSVTPKCAIITPTYSTFIGSLWCSLRYIQALLFAIFGSILGRKPCTFTLDIAYQCIYNRRVIDTLLPHRLHLIVLDKNTPLSFTIKRYMRRYLIKTLCSLIQWSSCSFRLLTEEEKSWLIKLIPSFPIISHPDDDWFCGKSLLLQHKAKNLIDSDFNTQGHNNQTKFRSTNQHIDIGRCESENLTGE